MFAPLTTINQEAEANASEIVLLARLSTRALTTAIARSRIQPTTTRRLRQAQMRLELGEMLGEKDGRFKEEVVAGEEVQARTVMIATIEAVPTTRASPTIEITSPTMSTTQNITANMIDEQANETPVIQIESKSEPIKTRINPTDTTTFPASPSTTTLQRPSHSSLYQTNRGYVEQDNYHLQLHLLEVMRDVKRGWNGHKLKNQNQRPRR